jgi:serine/threonine protein kinase
VNDDSDAKYTNKVDVWAMGCILYELLFRKKAFSGDMAVLSYYLSKERPGFPPKILLDDPLRELLETTIYSMLKLEPTERPTAIQLTETFKLNPQSLIMNNLVKKATFIQASAVHGSCLVTEDNSWIVLRRGYGATVTPSNTSNRGWLHFPIPTPVMVNDRRVRATKVIIKLRTGDKAFVSIVGSHDGEKDILWVQNLRVSGPLQDLALDIGARPEILGGLVVSLEVTFETQYFPDRNAGTWVEFYSVAVEFQ